MNIKTIIIMLIIGVITTIISVTLEELGKYNKAKTIQIFGSTIITSTTIVGVILLAKSLMKII